MRTGVTNGKKLKFLLPPVNLQLGGDGEAEAARRPGAVRVAARRQVDARVRPLRGRDGAAHASARAHRTPRRAHAQTRRLSRHAQSARRRGEGERPVD